MKNILLSMLFSALASCSFAQPTTWGIQFSDAIKTRYTPTINTMTSKGWEYSNSIITHGMEKIYENVHDAAYLNYIKAYIDAYITAGGGLPSGITSLDKIHPGISVLFLYEKMKLANNVDTTKYKTAALNLRNILVGPSATYPKTSPGNIFWHKNNGSYNNIVMLDGIYMAHPFLAKYGSLFHDNAAIDTAVDQTLYVYYQLYNAGTHLIKHAWNSDHTQAWADGSGNSPSYWSRATGWYVMALVDMLKYVPASHPRYTELRNALSNLATGIKNYQDAGTGLWYQVMDKGSSLSGNYLETSGSGMFVYALKTACDSGWISSATFLPVADAGWAGLKTRIDIYTDSKPRINHFAPAMSVQANDAAYVQSAYQPVDCPVVSGTQHPHGYAAILMAASVMEYGPVSLPLHFIHFSADDQQSKIRLHWSVGEEQDLLRFEIQRSDGHSPFVQKGQVIPSGKMMYEFTDDDVTGTQICYRIRAISALTVLYSPVITVRRPGSPVQTAVFPNPVTGKSITVQCQVAQTGCYTIGLYNPMGHAVLQRTVSLTAGLKQTLLLNNLPVYARGVYYLQIKGEDGLVGKQKLILQQE